MRILCVRTAIPQKADGGAARKIPAGIFQEKDRGQGDGGRGGLEKRGGGSVVPDSVSSVSIHFPSAKIPPPQRPAFPAFPDSRARGGVLRMGTGVV